MQETIKRLLEDRPKQMMIIPIVLMLLALGFLLSVQSSTGELIQKDVSLSGGMTLTVYTDNTINLETLQSSLQEHFEEVVIRALSEFGTDRTIGFVIETSAMDEETMRSTVQESTGIILTEENMSIEVVGSSLGESFYDQMVRALVFAFIFMSAAIFITFRKWAPSLAVVIVALGDLAITVAILNIMDVRISSAGIAALLLLMGYSIDTDVLLTTRILKRRQGTIFDGVWSSMKTGLTMTATTIAALFVAYLVSSSLVLKQMFMIIMIGLLVDIILTYLFNAPFLALYAKKQESGK